MFILAEMKNVTRIPPELFNLKLNDAIAGELNKKLANKVSSNHTTFKFFKNVIDCAQRGPVHRFIRHYEPARVLHFPG